MSDPASRDLADPRSGAGVVHIVDDDEAVRRSLALLLTAHGLASTTHASAEALLERLGTLPPGCIIADLRMPEMDGLGLLDALRRMQSGFPVVIVTGHADVGLAVRAMKAGAVDFVEKPYSERDLLRAVQTALTRQRDASGQREVAGASAARIAALTPREREVLRGLVHGQPNKVIAHGLGISPRTVEIHRANLMDKLNCRSLAEAVRLALAAGFVDGDAR